MVETKINFEVLLSFIIAIAIVVGFVSIFLSGLNEFSETDACEDEGCAFDNPAGFCAINSSSEGSGIACLTTPRESLPLGILFTVVLGIVFAAAVFVGLRKILRS